MPATTGMDQAESRVHVLKITLIQFWLWLFFTFQRKDNWGSRTSEHFIIATYICLLLKKKRFYWLIQGKTQEVTSI